MIEFKFRQEYIRFPKTGYIKKRYLGCNRLVKKGEFYGEANFKSKRKIKIDRG